MELEGAFRSGPEEDGRGPGRTQEAVWPLSQTDCVGETSFGTNYSIKRFTKNTLFDEKVGGTMHIAVGPSLPESGGRNKSSLHWDMVCDARKGFTVYGDGRPIMKDGKHSRFEIAD